MEEDTSKVGPSAPQTDSNDGEPKKHSLKLSSKAKFVNITQINADPALRAAKITPLPAISNIILSPASKTIAATTSLLKKLPGNISVSTQRISIQQQQSQQVSIMPNKPVVVQAINSPTNTTASGSSVAVGSARKIIFNPSDSRFLKIVNVALPETSTTSSGILPGKKVIVQRVEQIKPATVKTTQQDQVIIVPGNKPGPKVVVAAKDEPYIVNEMPPEMRTKAIVVSSNNPTGDQTIDKRDETRVYHNKLLPIKPRITVLSNVVKVPVSKEGPSTSVVTSVAVPIMSEVPKNQPITKISCDIKSGEFFGDEKKSSFEKLVDKFPEQISKVMAESMAKITPKPVKVTQATKNNAISMGKFDSIFNTINIQIKDGKLSNPNGPIQMLEGDSEETSDGKINKSPRMKARSKSTAIDARRPIPSSTRMNRSPSLSSILPEFTKQSKMLIKALEKNEARRETPDKDTTNPLDTLLCDENMDNVSGTGSNESSPAKASDISDNNKENYKNGKTEEENEKNLSNDTKSDENSDVEVVGFPENPEWNHMTPPESPVNTRKKRRASNEESEEDVPNVLKVPVHKLFKYQSDRITDDIHLSDPFRHITWKNGIGSLEDSTIHFKVNQLGVYEVMTNEEYYSLKKHKPDQELMQPVVSREKRKRKPGKEMLYRCMVCRGSGTADEFRSPTVCSWACEETLRMKIKTEENEDSNSTAPLTDLDENSLQDSPPAAVVKSTNINAPAELFQNPFPEAKNVFQIGMKLEAIDPCNQSLFCVCTVEDKRGCRIKLRFDSYPADYNFWVNTDSKNIFPPGWCSATDRTIDPPNNYNGGAVFDWNSYLKDPKVMAPVQMFPHLKINEGRVEHFKPGMKLEVDCPISLNLLGVTAGTINDIIGRRILIHLDFYDNRYDFWTNIDAPGLHPINYHKQKGVKIHTLYEKDFNWSTYLTDTRATAVPKKAFAPRDAINFHVGMKLEVVDPRNEGLVRPAVITDVNEHRICVLFEKWPAAYAFWMEDDDPNLHPTNWAKCTKHPLEPCKVKAKVNCQVIKFCRNVGNYLYKSKSGHKMNAECPYMLKNWLTSKLSDRLDYKRKMATIKKEKKSQPAQKTPVKDIKRLKPVIIANKTNGNIKEDEEEDAELTTIVSQPLKQEEQVKFGSELLKINSTTLPNIPNSVVNWTPKDVSTFVKSIPACEKFAPVFEKEEIDGTAFLSLTKDDLMHQLPVKFGPSVKIYNCILKLREEVLSEIV